MKSFINIENNNLKGVGSWGKQHLAAANQGMGIFQRKGLPERIFQNLVLVSWKNTNFKTMLLIAGHILKKHMVTKNYNMKIAAQNHCNTHALSIT